MKYTIVGCITNYSIDDIKPFVESLHQSGYAGGKEMLVYDVDQSVIDYLKSRNWVVYGGKLQEHIILQRFRDLYSIWKGRTNETIIWVDVKDVIFQNNPQEWIEELQESCDEKIFSFSECLPLDAHPWSCVNSGTTFPLEWQWNKSNVSYCAGTIVGEIEYLRDLFIEIYHWSKSTENADQLSDQAAYNILIRLEHFKDLVYLVSQNEGFVTQMGTSYDPNYKENLTERPPTVDSNGWVHNTDTGAKFYLVHQYDRYPDVKKLIQDRYKK